MVREYKTISFLKDSSKCQTHLIADYAYGAVMTPSAPGQR